MKVTCPECNKAVEAANINVQKDLAVCSNCGSAFQVSDLFDETPESYEQSNSHFDEAAIRVPPKGTWVNQTSDLCILGASTRSWAFLFLFPFTVIWSGFSTGMLYGSQIMSGEFNLFLSLFGLPFLAGSIALIVFTLMTIIGKIEIRIEKGTFQLLIGIYKWGYKKQMPWSSVRKISEKEALKGRTYQRVIEVLGEKKITFGTGLSEENMYFMLNVLKYWHSTLK